MDNSILSMLSYGMYIVCSEFENKKAGCVVNTLTQISENPDMVAISIRKQSETGNIIEKSGRFTASILSGNADMDMVGVFGFMSSAETDKFECTPHNFDKNGMPYITDGCLGVISCEVLNVIDFAPFQALTANGVTLETFVSLPDFAFFEAFKGIKEFEWNYLATIAVAYIPVAFVVFAEHIADHKNISSVVEEDLLENPGLHRTLLGDGVGSMVGAFFGGCPNTTYGESVGCVAITRNASVITITTTAIIAILISFVSPFVAFLDSIPGCVMGGVCITLYGFIAVSGLKMIQKVDLEDHANLFTVSAILISGIGGMAMSIGKVTITAIACALILGIIVNVILHKFQKKED